MTNNVVGKAWRYGSDIDTDTILPSQYMRLEPAEYASHAMEAIDPSFTEKITDGDIIVAERNFGIGSSREQAVVALQVAGVGAIIAESFARVFYRNAINGGLPALTCSAEAIESISEGTTLSIDIDDGTIRDNSSEKIHRFDPLQEPVKSILEAGGATEYYR